MTKTLKTRVVLRFCYTTIYDPGRSRRQCGVNDARVLDAEGELDARQAAPKAGEPEAVIEPEHPQGPLHQAGRAMYRRRALPAPERRLSPARWSHRLLGQPHPRRPPRTPEAGAACFPLGLPIAPSRARPTSCPHGESGSPPRGRLQPTRNHPEPEPAPVVRPPVPDDVNRNADLPFSTSSGRRLDPGGGRRAATVVGPESGFRRLVRTSFKVAGGL